MRCRPAVRLHQPALRAPQPGGDDEPAVRPLVRGLPRPDGRRRGHRSHHPPLEGVSNHGLQLQAGGREAEPGGDGRRKGANALMSPDRARTTMRWGDAPSGAPRSHPLTTSAPIRAQRGDRREPVRYKRRPPTAAGFGRLRERLQTDAPCAPDCGFSRHMSRCEPRASTRPRDPSNLGTVSREGGHGLTN